MCGLLEYLSGYDSASLKVTIGLDSYFLIGIFQPLLSLVRESSLQAGSRLIVVYLSAIFQKSFFKETFKTVK